MDKFLESLKVAMSSKRLFDYIENNLFEFILAVILICFFTVIRTKITDIFARINRKVFKENKGLETFFNSVTKIIVNIVLIVIIIDLLGINLKGIYAVTGALSLILGFAFKESLANIFGGLIILSFKPFKLHDLIEYKQYTGTVTKIEIFYTTILTFQNENIMIPNSNLINNEVKNINANTIRRLDLKVGVGYNSNIKLVKDIIQNVIDNKKEEYFDYSLGEPIIGLTNFGESSIDFDIKVYIQEGKIGKARYYILETLKEEFDKNNISIPYNILDVYLKNEG